ncbi:hypothetical protein [Methanosarcina sp.]|uniref:hypothetical protein n=1 Tax=Methanosarcina sp. TaxID=2213 RepID=UPI003BB596A1
MTEYKKVPRYKFQKEIKDAIDSGWTLKSQNDNTAILIQRDLGDVTTHAVLMGASWILGVPIVANFSYMGYSLIFGRELHIIKEDL